MNRGGAYGLHDQATMIITDILDKSCVRVPLESNEKNAAITELVDVLHKAGKIDDRDAVLEAILSRERTRSTGIGKGLAVPHGKSPSCSGLAMAIGKPQEPLEFDSVDGKPCDLIVLLASSVDRTGPHIQALACISRLWLNEEFRRAVITADKADAVYEAIERFQGE